MRATEAAKLIQSTLMGDREFRDLQRDLAARGSLRLRVASGSMEPCLAPGEVVEIRPCVSEPRRFDIVAYWDGKHLICHAFWHANEPGWGAAPLFVARGLAPGLGEDLPAPRDQLLGVVASHRLRRREKLLLLLRSLLSRR